MKQYYKIAGLVVEMDSFGRTVEQARPYACEPAQPDLIIRSDWQSLQQRQPHLSDEDCEYMSTGGNFYRQLLKFNGMMLHASAVVLDGKAYLFSAPCGTGKSTHTKLWLQVFGDRALILNDDKPALRFEDGAWYVYGTPWSGKHDISANVRVPLQGICFLHQAKENTIERMDAKSAYPTLLNQTYRRNDPEGMIKTLELVGQLAKLSVYSLGCTISKEAVMLAYHTIVEGSKEKNYLVETKII